MGIGARAQYVYFGGTSGTDTARTNNSILIMKLLRLPYYAATGDTTLLGFDANGKAYKLTKTMISNWGNTHESIWLNIRDFGAIPNDGISDRAAYQAACNQAGTDKNIVIYTPNDGVYNLDTTVIFKSNTTFWGGYVKLLDSVNRTMFQNYSCSPDSANHVVDTNIAFYNMTIDGNGMKQGATLMPNFAVGIRVSQVGKIIFDHVTILNTRSYAMHIPYTEDFVFTNGNIDQTDPANPNSHPNTNKDGLDFGGGKNIRISNSSFKCYDDCIALNSQDGIGGVSFIYDNPNGNDIVNVAIDNIVFNHTEKGIRILSLERYVSGISINNISGFSEGNIFEMSTYYLGAAGNVGDISISNVNVEVRKYEDENRDIFGFGCKGRSLSLSNINVRNNRYDQSLLGFQYDFDFDVVNISNVTSINEDSLTADEIKFASGAKARYTYLNNIKASGVNKPNGSLFNLKGFTGKVLNVSNCFVDTALYSLKIDSSTIGELILSDNACQKTSGIYINSTTIDSTTITGKYFADTTGLAFTATGSTVDNLNNTIQSKNGTITPLRYKKSAVVYTSPTFADKGIWVSNGTSPFVQDASYLSYDPIGHTIGFGGSYHPFAVAKITFDSRYKDAMYMTDTYNGKTVAFGLGVGGYAFGVRSITDGFTMGGWTDYSGNFAVPASLSGSLIKSTAPSTGATTDAVVVWNSTDKEFKKGVTIDAGLFTPTLSGTNVTSSTLSDMHYQKVGSEVHISGRARITNTDPGGVGFSLTIPFAVNNFISVDDCNGTTTSNTFTAVSAVAKIADTKLYFTCTAASGGMTGDVNYSLTYTIK